MVPLLTSLVRLPQHLAHGTSLVIILFVALAGLSGYWLRDNVDWAMALWLALGSAVGAYAGARTMARMPEQALRLVFGLFLITMAVRMFIE